MARAEIDRYAGLLRFCNNPSSIARAELAAKPGERERRRNARCVFIGNMIPRGVGKNGTARAAPMAALLLLSLLWTGSALRVDLLPDLQPNLLPHLERQVLTLALLALSAGLIAIERGAEWPRWRLIRDAIVIGLGLFALPAVLIDLADGSVSGLARIALLTLVPLFAVIFEPYIGLRSAPQNRGGLLAALVAGSGSFLVFPVAIPNSISAGGAFVAVILAAACIAAANCYGVTTATALNGGAKGQIAMMASIASASAAAALTIASICLEQPIWKWNALEPELLWSAAIELPALLLVFWLMRRMSAPRMATRYALAPLLAIVIEVALLQYGRDVRLQTWLGLILMAAGAAWILFAPPEETQPSALPLDLDRR